MLRWCKYCLENYFEILLCDIQKASTWQSLTATIVPIELKPIRAKNEV